MGVNWVLINSGNATSSQRFNKKSHPHWIKSPAFQIESEDEKTLSCHANCLNENRYIFQEILAINIIINIVMGEKNAIILTTEHKIQCSHQSH